MSEPTKAAVKAAEVITNHHLEGIAYEVGAGNVPVAQRFMADAIDRETGLPELIESALAIRKACEANAAPTNLDYALTQVHCVDIDSGLLEALFAALRKAGVEL